MKISVVVRKILSDQMLLGSPTTLHMNYKYKITIFALIRVAMINRRIIGIGISAIKNDYSVLAFHYC